MKNKKISLIILTKNESTNIEKNLKWVNSCDEINEIIIVDDDSTDETIKTLKKIINKEKNLKIFKKKLNKDFSKQRNFAISKTKNNLILWLDADEYPSKKLIKFLKNIDENKYNNYSFQRKDIFLNKELKHGETSHLNFVRLFNKKHGQFIGKVHEVWKSTKPIKRTKLIIYHDSHPTLKSFIKKIDFYSTIRAQELFNKKIKTNLFQIIFFPIGKFIQNYMFRLGFLDRMPGIIMALSMSLHVFLSKAKLWHLHQQ